jgi:hypothetical protein
MVACLYLKKSSTQVPATSAPNAEQVRDAVSPIVLSKACPPVMEGGFNANNATNLLLEPFFGVQNNSEVLAAMMKSFLCSPWMLWVHQMTVTDPYSTMSRGWWFSCSASSAMALVNRIELA